MEKIKQKHFEKNKGLKYGIYGIVISLFALALKLYWNPYSMSYVPVIIGLVGLVAIVFSIIGLINSIKELSKKVSIKKIIGLLLNLIILFCFAYLITAVLYDAYRMTN